MPTATIYDLIWEKWSEQKHFPVVISKGGKLVHTKQRDPNDVGELNQGLLIVIIKLPRPVANKPPRLHHRTGGQPGNAGFLLVCSRSRYRFAPTALPDQ